MKKYIIAWATALISMLFMDGVWLSIMAKRFYAPRFGNLMAATPHFTPVVIFYLLYNFGLAYFIIIPALYTHTSVYTLFLKGALFGLVAYATYDLTNQATLKDWSILVTIVDLAWGAFISGSVTVIANYLTKWLMHHA